MTEIVAGRNYWARVDSVSTIGKYRHVRTNTVLALRCKIVFWISDTPVNITVYWNRKTHGIEAPLKGHTILVTAYQQSGHGPMRFRPVTAASIGKGSRMTSDNHMLGYVNWAPNKQSCYVRVNIPNRETGIPLCIKATFATFHWTDLEKDDVVEIVRTDRMDARRFKVIRLLKTFEVEVEPPAVKENVLVGHKYRAVVCYISTVSGKSLSMATVIKLRCNIFSADADTPPLAIGVYWNKRTHGDNIPERGEAIDVYTTRKGPCGGIKFSLTPGKDYDMAMSKDRVRFYIRDTYFNSQERRLSLANVMAKAFGINKMSATSWLHGDGLWIVCRPSQFARFLIYRNDANIVNGFMDLRAKLVTGSQSDVYDTLAKEMHMTRSDVKKVALALGFDTDAVEGAIAGPFVGNLDVSKNLTIND